MDAARECGPLEQAQVDELCSEQLPGGRLPTTEELCAAVQDPRNADPRLLSFLDRRPQYKRFIYQCLGNENEAA